MVLPAWRPDWRRYASQTPRRTTIQKFALYVRSKVITMRTVERRAPPVAHALKQIQYKRQLRIKQRHHLITRANIRAIKACVRRGMLSLTDVENADAELARAMRGVHTGGDSPVNRDAPQGNVQRRKLLDAPQVNIQWHKFENTVPKKTTMYKIRSAYLKGQLSLDYIRSKSAKAADALKVSCSRSINPECIRWSLYEMGHRPKKTTMNKIRKALRDGIITMPYIERMAPQVAGEIKQIQDGLNLRAYDAWLDNELRDLTQMERYDPTVCLYELAYSLM